LCPNEGSSVINKSKIIKDAQKFVAKGQWDKAIAEYEKILKDTPSDANTHNTVGDLYLKRNDKDNSIESFKKAAEIFNKDGFTLKAIALYKKVLNINPDRVDILMLMGKLNAERGMLGSANEHYLAAAAYFSRQGQKVKAIDIYKTLCDLNPDNYLLTQTLAELYLSEGFEKEGLSKFIDLAEKKIASGELREAHELLDKIAPKSSERFEFIRVSSMLDLKENRLPEAIEKLEKIKSLDPNDKVIADQLAEALQRSGRYEEAGAIYQELLEKDPANKTYRKNFITVFIKAGDYTSAWKEYAHLVESHVSKNEFSEAEELVKDFLKHKPDDIEARQSLVQIYKKSDRENEVPALHREMADIYFDEGDHGKAANIYRQLLQNDPENIEIMNRLGEIEHGAPPEKPSESAPAETFQPPEEAELTPPPTYSLDDDIGLAGITATDEPVSETGGYELPDVEGGLPDLDLGEESPFPDQPEAGENVFELPDTGTSGLEDLDIFESADSAEAPLATGGIDLDEFQGLPEQGIEEFKPAPVKVAPEPALTEEGISLEELLTEVDVYIKYGIFNKAEEILDSICRTHPANPDITKKKIELSKGLGDVEGFVKLSLELTEQYIEREMYSEAEDVVEKALAMDPDNAILSSRLKRLSELSITEDAEPPEQEAPSLEIPDEIETFEPAGQEFGVMPGSVHYMEELAEAEFYSQQGLIDEATAIYRRLLASNPGDVELIAKLEGLQKVAESKPEVELVPLEATAGNLSFTETPEEQFEASAPSDLDFMEASAPEPPVESYEAPPATLEDDLDAAFKELDLDEEEQTETPSEAPVMAAPPPEEPEEAEFFDLAAELQEDLEDEIIKPDMPAESFEDKHLEAVFHEFKKGVEEQLGKEDYETHYNLGIAYKEMGMLDEALSEFTLASRDVTRSLDCASMLGLCYIEKAEYDKAIALFKKGLDIKGRDKEEYMGLKYDLATALELKGDTAAAYLLNKEIAESDPSFRDVLERVESLKDSAPSAPAAPEPPKPDKPAGPPPKKSKVSYL